MHIEFHGAAREVTGSAHLIECNGYRILLDCGLIQGGRKDEARNREPFPFDPQDLHAVVLSHSHIDHSGRLPLLVKQGFTGKIYTQRACRDLCRIMLNDAAYINEHETEWENRKRLRKGLPLLEPLYSAADVKTALQRFKAIDYNSNTTVAPGIRICLNDAGHILGSSIVEVWLEENGQQRKLVFSGDLGDTGAPILRDPAVIVEADTVILESTYGDRLHRLREQTMSEIKQILQETLRSRGNILIPAFAVGRTQELLYLFAKHRDELELDRWQIFLDSPLAIQATEIYVRHAELYDKEAAALWHRNNRSGLLPNLTFTRTPKQSMNLNKVHSGAMIIAGSGMCTGGRIKHHLKHNIWRKDCHVIIPGFQARGTTGRALVDGAGFIRLWGETIRVAANIHTVGGLSAHADQHGLCNWYANFRNTPPVILVHGETASIDTLATKMRNDFSTQITVPVLAQRIEL